MPHRESFDPSDLEALEIAFEAAWCAVEADASHSDPSHDELLKARLRQKLFQLAEPGKINPEQLCKQALLAVLGNGRPSRNGGQP